MPGHVHARDSQPRPPTPPTLSGAHRACVTQVSQSFLSSPSSFTSHTAVSGVILQPRTASLSRHHVTYPPQPTHTTRRDATRRNVTTTTRPCLSLPPALSAAPRETGGERPTASYSASSASMHRGGRPSSGRPLKQVTDDIIHFGSLRCFKHFEVDARSGQELVVTLRARQRSVRASATCAVPIASRSSSSTRLLILGAVSVE